MEQTKLAEAFQSRLDTLLDAVNYKDIDNYVPSVEAVQFLNVCKLIDGGNPENKTPVAHLRFLDLMFEDDEDVINLCFRGFAKTTVMRRIILYTAIFGRLPYVNAPKFTYGLYVSDTMENGVKKMRENIEAELETSAFLREYLVDWKITENSWKFTNKDGHKTVWGGFGATTGVRGTSARMLRPSVALLDDLMSDKVAESPTLVAKVKQTINKAIRNALHPTQRKIIWAGTPFNEADPIVSAIENGAYKVNVFPIAEKFPVSRKEFSGAWEERFPYKMVLREYETMKKDKDLPAFYQELMLRISSDEGRILDSTQFMHYSLKDLMDNKSAFNFYVTTDLATSSKQHADYSVKIVWAINNNSDIFYVHGLRDQCETDQNIDDIFNLVQLYGVKSVGVEVNGQQGAITSWLTREMMHRRNFFTLASNNNSNVPGIRRQGDKISEVRAIQPWFAHGKMHFPEELANDPVLTQIKRELLSCTKDGIKSKNDDCVDAVTQLVHLNMWAPSANGMDDGNITTDDRYGAAVSYSNSYEDSPYDGYL